MPIPTYDQFIEPILRYLGTHREGARARQVHEAAADALAIPDADRQELLPSGVQPVYKNRAGWAHDRLKRAGLSTSPRRGFWKLSPAGIAFLDAHPSPLSREQVDEIATEHMDVRLRDAAPTATDGQTPQPAPAASTATPDDRLEEGDALNRSRIATVVCVALTSNLKWASAPGNVLRASSVTGLPKESVANVSQVGATRQYRTMPDLTGTAGACKMPACARSTPGPRDAGGGRHSRRPRASAID